MEGVLAVMRLTRIHQQLGKVALQVFDRRGGSDVRFEEYADLDPNVAAELVLRAKSNKTAPTYGYGYGAGPGVSSQLPPVNMPTNLSQLITTMDPASLQKLLGAMQSPTAPQQPGAPTALTPDLAKLLIPAVGAPPAAPFGQAPPAHDPLAALRNNPALAGLLGSHSIPPPINPLQMNQPPPPGVPPPQIARGGQPDMADILARLGSYQR